jgi:hypothetical protein
MPVCTMAPAVVLEQRQRHSRESPIIINCFPHQAFEEYASHRGINIIRHAAVRILVEGTQSSQGRYYAGNRHPLQAVATRVADPKAAINIVDLAPGGSFNEASG